MYTSFLFMNTDCVYIKMIKQDDFFLNCPSQKLAFSSTFIERKLELA